MAMHARTDRDENVDWARAKAIFADLVELPMTERAAMLAAHVAEAPELLDAIERLLVAHEDDTFLAGEDGPSGKR